MPTETPPPVSPQTPTRPPGRHRWLLFGCGGLLAVALIAVAAVFITLWWIQRPIKPVVLTPPEKAKVEAKLHELEASPPATPQGKTSTRLAPPVQGGGNPTVELPPVVVPDENAPRPGRAYVPGGKLLKLTEREINGLLNENTDLGKSVRLEFAQDAINAYLAVRIPDDFPVGSGKMFRARGRF